MYDKYMNVCTLDHYRYVTLECIVIIILFVCSLVDNVVSKPVPVIAFV